MKNNIKSVERRSDNPLVQIQVNEPIEKDIFYWRGVSYIVGQKRRWNGQLWEMELMPILGYTGMHIHKYYNGICHICGIYKEKVVADIPLRMATRKGE